MVDVMPVRLPRAFEIPPRFVREASAFMERSRG
jgi:hypothetical protein